MISAVCPQEIRAANHKAKNREIWRTKEWRAAVKTFKILHPVCKYCGQPTWTGHHTDLDGYGDLDYYIRTLFEKGEPVCSSCHWHIHHNFQRCPCGNGWRKISCDYCPSCVPAEIKEKREYSKVKQRQRQREYQRAQALKAKLWKAAHPRSVKHGN